MIFQNVAYSNHKFLVAFIARHKYTSLNGNLCFFFAQDYLSTNHNQSDLINIVKHVQDGTAPCMIGFDSLYEGGEVFFLRAPKGFRKIPQHTIFDLLAGEQNAIQV